MPSAVICLSFAEGTLSPTLIVMAFPFPHGFALNCRVNMGADRAARTTA
jgi:hypothetical protein